MRFSPSVRPMLVVVLPSPAGVGVMAVTSTSLPVGGVVQPVIQVQRHLGLVLAVVFQVVVGDAQLARRSARWGGSRRGGQSRCRAAVVASVGIGDWDWGLGIGD